MSGLLFDWLSSRRFVSLQTLESANALSDTIRNILTYDLWRRTIFSAYQRNLQRYPWSKEQLSFSLCFAVNSLKSLKLGAPLWHSFVSALPANTSKGELIFSDFSKLTVIKPDTKRFGQAESPLSLLFYSKRTTFGKLQAWNFPVFFFENLRDSKKSSFKFVLFLSLSLKDIWKF